MRSRNPQWVALATVVVVLGGGGAAGWSHWHTSGQHVGRPAARPAPPTIADAHEVAVALSKLPDKPEDYVATDVRSVVQPLVAGALPPGATISADEASWHPDGLDGGTITITMTAPAVAPATYTAIMIKESSGWKVIGTIPMTPTNRGTAPAGQGAAPAANVPGGTTALTPTATATPSGSPRPKKAKSNKPTPTPSATPGTAE